MMVSVLLDCIIASFSYYCNSKRKYSPLTCAHFIADLLRHEIVQVSLTASPRKLLTSPRLLIEMPSGKGSSTWASVLGQMTDIDTLTLTTDALLRPLVSGTDMCHGAQCTFDVLTTHHRDIRLTFRQRQSKGARVDSLNLH